MSRAAGAGWCAAGLAILVLAGCGESATPAQKLARCVDRQQETGGFGLPVSNDAWVASVRRICRQAAREDLISAQGGLSKKEAQRLAVRHPRLLYPMCEASELETRDTLDPGAAKHLREPALRRLGRHYCNVVTASGIAFDSDGLTGADRNALARRHPELLMPFCIAGADSSYDKERSHNLSRADFHKVMGSVCSKALRRGYIRPSGGNDDAAIEALAKSETLKMIHRGDVHLLTVD